MAEKVDITDPYKVDPSLKGKSKKQLEMERDLRNMAIGVLEEEEKRAAVEGTVTRANELMQTIVSAFNELNELNVLTDEQKAPYTSASGVFAPHLRFKALTADRVLARMGDAPKKTRRKKAEK